jgi:hypothetical protein
MTTFTTRDGTEIFAVDAGWDQGRVRLHLEFIQSGARHVSAPPEGAPLSGAGYKLGGSV